MMRNRFNSCAAAAGILFLAAGAGRAADLVCTGPSSGGIWRNVVVPAGLSCTLDNTRVTGNVMVQAGGTLLIDTTSGMDTGP